MRNGSQPLNNEFSESFAQKIVNDWEMVLRRFNLNPQVVLLTPEKIEFTFSNSDEVRIVDVSKDIKDRAGYLAFNKWPNQVRGYDATVSTEEAVRDLCHLRHTLNSVESSIFGSIESLEDRIVDERETFARACEERQ